MMITTMTLAADFPVGAVGGGVVGGLVLLLLIVGGVLFALKRKTVPEKQAPQPATKTQSEYAFLPISSPSIAEYESGRMD
jgi:hypothetical protein